MSKIFLFFLLTWLTGNPFIAIIVLLIVFYALDRRFVGLTPSVVKPIRRMRRIGRLRKHIALSPSDVSAKLELARLLIERKKHRAAMDILEPLQERLSDSAEYWDDLGTCYLETGEPAKGEEAMLRALERNPRVKYGDPYLRLASYYSNRDTEKALGFIEAFQDIQSSSCEAYVRLAELYKRVGKPGEAKEAVEEGLRTYRVLPRYKKRAERKWAVRLRAKKWFG